MHTRISAYRCTHLIFLLVSTVCFGTKTEQKLRPTLQIATEKRWYTFSNPLPQNNTLLLWYTTITIRSHNPLHLKQLTLQWQPVHPAFTLTPVITQASLYYNKGNRGFIPVEDQFISHGTWNADTHTLIFPVNRKLIGVQAFHIVLHCTANMIPTLSRGSLQYIDAYPPITTPIKNNSKFLS